MTSEERKKEYNRVWWQEHGGMEKDKIINDAYKTGLSIGQICEKFNFKMVRVYQAIFKVKINGCSPKSHIDCLNCQYEDCINQSQGLFDFEKKLRPNIPKTSYTISMMIDRARAGRSSWNF